MRTEPHRHFRWTRRRLRVVWAVLAGLCLGGCNNRMLDPTQIGRFRTAPAVNVILDSLGVAEENPMAYDQAEEPRPSDLIAQEQDITLGSGDILRVDVYELYAAGQLVSQEFVVSETGEISVPAVGVLQVAGLTEKQVEQMIRQRLEPAVLKSPKITVTLVSSQRRRFSIVGEGVASPGAHPIPRFDFRLLDALALAGGPRQLGVSTIYVARREASPAMVRSTARPDSLAVPQPVTAPQGWSQFMNKQPSAWPSAASVPWPRTTVDRERESLGMVSANSPRPWNRQDSPVVAATSMPAISPYEQVVRPSQFDEIQRQLQSGEPVPATGSPLGADRYGTTAPSSTTQPKVEWIFKDGRWVPVPVGPGSSTTTPGTLPGATAPGWTAPGGLSTVGPGGTWTSPTRPGTTSAGGAAPPLPGGTSLPPAGTSAPGLDQGQWILQNGQWTYVPNQASVPVTPPTQPTGPGGTVGLSPFEPSVSDGFWQEARTNRLIRIPVDQLLAGNGRYNIVIRPGDTIYVPYDQLGFFYIMGNVARTGKISLSGEPLTLMGAIATAGGLGPLAWPKKVEVRRRLDRNREEIVMVDLDKIARGEQPDFYIKPNDVINVGTHYSSRWRAVLRNAFRAAVGFSFVYDRNFADDYYYDRGRWF